MAIGDNIKYLRTSHGLSQTELGKIAGVTDKAVSTWEKGEKTPRMGAIERMAAYFGVTKSYIIDGRQTAPVIPEGFQPMPPMENVPLVGSIACGTPILAEQNVEDVVSIPSEWHASFTLMCKGDSMVGSRINDGDIVYIRLQEEVENGEIAAVLVDDAGESNATLKRVYLYENQIVLQAENPKYSPWVYTGEDMNKVRIIGKAVAFLSEVQ